MTDCTIIVVDRTRGQQFTLERTGDVVKVTGDVTGTEAVEILEDLVLDLTTEAAA